MLLRNLSCYGVMFVFLCSQIKADICEIDNFHNDCPGPSDPPSYSRCCMFENSTDVYCCESLNHEQTNRLVMLVSLTVISLCLSISVLTIVCCFWSRCPLFYSCRVNYDARRGIIAYFKEEEALNQPPDENEYCQEYSPVNVKINKMEEY